MIERGARCDKDASQQVSISHIAQIILPFKLKILVIGCHTRRIDAFKACRLERKGDIARTWTTSHTPEGLTIRRRFLLHPDHWKAMIDHDSFKQQQFIADRRKISYGLKRVLKVIQQTVCKHHIEPAEA